MSQSYECICTNNISRHFIMSLDLALLPFTCKLFKHFALMLFLLKDFRKGALLRLCNVVINEINFAHRKFVWFSKRNFKWSWSSFDYWGDESNFKKSGSALDVLKKIWDQFSTSRKCCWWGSFDSLEFRIKIFFFKFNF